MDTSSIGHIKTHIIDFMTHLHKTKNYNDSLILSLLYFRVISLRLLKIKIKRHMKYFVVQK